MGWPECTAERLRHKGVIEVNGNVELAAKPEAVEFALAIWRNQAVDPFTEGRIEYDFPTWACLGLWAGGGTAG